MIVLITQMKNIVQIQAQAQIQALAQIQAQVQIQAQILAQVQVQILWPQLPHQLLLLLQHLILSSIANGLVGVIGVNVRLLAETDIKKGHGEKFKKPHETPRDYPVPEMTLKEGFAHYNHVKNVESNQISANLIFKTILVPGNV